MPSDTPAKRLGERLLQKPKLTEKEIREAVVEARQETEDEAELVRVRVLLRRAEFEIRVGRVDQVKAIARKICGTDQKPTAGNGKTSMPAKPTEQSFP